MAVYHSRSFPVRLCYFYFFAQNAKCQKKSFRSERNARRYSLVRITTAALTTPPPPCQVLYIFILMRYKNILCLHFIITFTSASILFYIHDAAAPRFKNMYIELVILSYKRQTLAYWHFSLLCVFQTINFAHTCPAWSPELVSRPHSTDWNTRLFINTICSINCTSLPAHQK